MKNKIVQLKEAIALIKDGDSIATAMANNTGNAAYLLKGIEDSFLTTGTPKGLIKYSGGGTAGDAHLAHSGLIKKYIGSHPGACMPMMKMVENNEFEAYGMPQGVMQQLYRCSATHQPGLLTKIGMGTYVDPRYAGGRLNDAAKDQVCEFREIAGEAYLFYRAFSIDVALIRGTTADEDGNITIEEEAQQMEMLSIALAAKANGGKVIAQVKYIAKNGSLNPKLVVVPAEVVDAVVLVQEPEKYHRQTLADFHNPYFSGERRAPKEATAIAHETLDMPNLICRRAAFELSDDAVVNVGYGIGVGVCSVAAEEDIADCLSFVIGIFGGIPEPKDNFGSVYNPSCILPHQVMFDFYHGGSLDISFMGAAEIDAAGNVNVSRFGTLKAGRGQGGFIDISSCAKKVVFCSIFKSDQLKEVVENSELKILKEGRTPKFVENVTEITFNGKMALERNQEVIFITERGVFELKEEGVMLTEIAPGINLKEDILDQMGFSPLISKELKRMDQRIYTPGKMGIFNGGQKL